MGRSKIFKCHQTYKQLKKKNHSQSVIGQSTQRKRRRSIISLQVEILVWKIKRQKSKLNKILNSKKRRKITKGVKLDEEEVSIEVIQQNMSMT